MGLRQKDEQKQIKANTGILRCAQNDNLWWLRQNDDFSGGCAQNDNLRWLRQNDDSWGCSRMTARVVVAGKRLIRCGLFS